LFTGLSHGIFFFVTQTIKKQFSHLTQSKSCSLLLQTLKKAISLSDGTNTPVNIVSARSLFAHAIGSSKDKGLSFLTLCLVTLSGDDKDCSCLSSLSCAVVIFSNDSL